MVDATPLRVAGSLGKGCVSRSLSSPTPIFESEMCAALAGIFYHLPYSSFIRLVSDKLAVLFVLQKESCRNSSGKFFLQNLAKLNIKSPFLLDLHYIRLKNNPADCLTTHFPLFFSCLACLKFSLSFEVISHQVITGEQGKKYCETLPAHFKCDDSESSGVVLGKGCVSRSLSSPTPIFESEMCAALAGIFYHLPYSSFIRLVSDKLAVLFILQKESCRNSSGKFFLQNLAKLNIKSPFLLDLHYIHLKNNPADYLTTRFPLFFSCLACLKFSLSFEVISHQVITGEQGKKYCETLPAHFECDDSESSGVVLIEKTNIDSLNLPCHKVYRS